MDYKPRVRFGVHVLCKVHTAILEAAPAGSSQPPRTRNAKHSPGAAAVATWFPPYPSLSAANALQGEASCVSVPSIHRQRSQSTAPWGKIGTISKSSSWGQERLQVENTALMTSP